MACLKVFHGFCLALIVFIIFFYWLCFFCCFICFLLFFTNHSTTPINFNFLWSFFPNLFVSFILLKKNIPSWVIKYINLYLVLLLVTLFVSIAGIQKFSFVLFPIISMLFMRSFYLHKILNTKK